MWNSFFFSKFCSVLVVFLFFYYFWHFIFKFVSLYLSKNSRNFYGFFILWIRDFIKEFWKIIECFSTKYRHFPEFFINPIVYYLFFFILLAFWESFFPISPIHTCQKMLNIFVVLYHMDYRFYQKILENSWMFFKKNRDTLNTKHIQNSIVYSLVF